MKLFIFSKCNFFLKSRTLIEILGVNFSFYSMHITLCKYILELSIT